jgi:thiamine biosynthesis lipoprotein
MPAATQVSMNTIVSIRIVRETETADARDTTTLPHASEALARAFGWFDEVEAHCSRFDPASELRRLCERAIAEAVEASPLLFEAVHFAVLLAHETAGAFDPAVGHRLAARGFNREHRSGAIAPADGSNDATYRDIELDATRRTIRLHRPLTLDLGAVAKGLAIDLAARELQPFVHFAIDAGGDLYLGGLNDRGEPWSIGIRHPRHPGELIARVPASNQAVCTSGNYARGEHLLDPRNGDCARSLASATVIAPNAMLADALATAAFVLGPEEGLALLKRCGVEGLLITPGLTRYQTGGLALAA